MPATGHEDGCWYPRAQEEVKRYYSTWPNACKRCEGWGGFPWYDHDTGHQDFDPCPKCLEKGKCPRCSGAVISEAYWDAGHFTNCDHCGYVEAVTSGAPLTNEPCSCIERWDDYADVGVCAGCNRIQELDSKGVCDYCVDKDLAEDHYPYELSDRLYDENRERRRL